MIDEFIDNTNKLIMWCDKIWTGQEPCNIGFKFGDVGKGWCQDFLKRNGEKIVTRRGEKFAVDRLDWTTSKKIEQMNDIITDEMVVANVGEKLIIPIYCHNEGNEVKNVENSFCKMKNWHSAQLSKLCTICKWDRMQYQSEEGQAHCWHQIHHKERNISTKNIFYFCKMLHCPFLPCSWWQASVLSHDFSVKTTIS